jgi:hypothetical protein
MKKKIQRKIGRIPYTTYDIIIKTAKIDHAASGDNTIIPAVSNKTLKIFALTFVVSGAVNVKFKRGTTDLTGDLNFASKGQGVFSAINPPAFLMQTAAGEAFIMNLSAAVAVDGFVSYWEE